MRIIAVMSPKGGIGKTTTSDERSRRNVFSFLTETRRAIHPRHSRHTSRRERE